MNENSGAIPNKYAETHFSLQGRNLSRKQPRWLFQQPEKVYLKETSEHFRQSVSIKTKNKQTQRLFVYISMVSKRTSLNESPWVSQKKCKIAGSEDGEDILCPPHHGYSSDGEDEHPRENQIVAWKWSISDH